MIIYANNNNHRLTGQYRNKRVLLPVHLFQGLINGHPVHMPVKKHVGLWGTVDCAIDTGQDDMEEIGEHGVGREGADTIDDDRQDDEIHGNLKPQTRAPTPRHSCRLQAFGVDEGRIDITVAHDGYGAVRFEVADNGCGLPSEDVKRVFDPFFTRKPGGSGLGLAITRRLLEANGGEIDLAPRKPRGATVTITFRSLAPPGAASQAEPPADA